jgi:hypothetical protein
MADPGKNIDDKKQKAIDSLKAKFDQMNNIAYDIMIQAIEQHFDFEKGKVKITSSFVKQLNKLAVDVLDMLQNDPKFIGPIGQFVKKLEPISDAISDFQKQTNGITVPDYVTAKKIVIDEILDQMTNNGLNQGFVQPLRDLMYQSFTTGLTLSDAKEQIKEFIKGGKDTTGKLNKYVEQTAQQAVDGYSGAINKKLMQQFNYDAVLMTGSLIETSSPQCKYASKELNRKITEDNWPELKKIAEKHGLIEGTTLENLPLNLLHFGCRHGFYPIILKKQKAA